MGVKSHSAQIGYSKPRGMHIITKADAVNPDGCTLLKRFYGCLFHTSSVWMNILTCRLARSYRNQSYKTSTFSGTRDWERLCYPQHDFFVGVAFQKHIRHEFNNPPLVPLRFPGLQDAAWLVRGKCWWWVLRDEWFVCLAVFLNVVCALSYPN